MIKNVMALAKASRLSNIHPVEKLMLCIMPIIILGFYDNVIPIGVNILFFIALHSIIKNNRKIVMKFTVEITVFVAFSSLTFIFEKGAMYCLPLIMRATSAGLCLSFFALSTPLDDLLLLGAKTEYFRDFCDIAKSMERYIIIISDEFSIMHAAMKSRGGFNGYKNTVENMGKLAGLLFVNTMNRWKSINEGLSARGYNGITPYSAGDFAFSYKRFSLICAYDAILIIINLWR